LEGELDFVIHQAIAIVDRFKEIKQNIYGKTPGRHEIHEC